MKTNLNVAYFSLLILALTIDFDYSKREIFFIKTFFEKITASSQFIIKTKKKQVKSYFPIFHNQEI